MKAEFRPDMSIGAAIKLAADRLRAMADDPSHEARLLVCAATGVGRLAAMADPDRRLGEAANTVEAHVARREAQEPVSRILGRRGFWSLDLEISPDVLDPRPDTELIIEVAVTELDARRRDPLRILDLGIGSGAILAALLTEFQAATGVGVDLSAAACGVARRNLAACGLVERSAVVEGGWDVPLPGRFDLVVSNPPYIESGLIAGLDPDVRLYDPMLALDGGPDGLAAYRTISARLNGLLEPDGWGLFETGFDQTERVLALLAGAGLRPGGVWKDLGGHPRIVGCRAIASVSD